ncbi:MAG: mechanosensitive ion channel family protein [Patescibacteria group bacterium]|nr:mechanosensitive ion channel family protein [Patescibacteria group bacterium]
MDTSFLSTEYWGNTIQNYLIFIGLFFVLLVFFKIFQALLLHRLKKLAQKSKTDIDDMLIEIIEHIKPPFYLYFSLYLAALYLNKSGIFQNILNALLIAILVYQVAVAIQILINYIAKRKYGQEEDPGKKQAVNTVSVIAKIIVWSFGLLLVLSNLGVNITSLVAGLGIGGLAIGLALQNILSDLFSSFAIRFDKPFVIGDFIVVGKHMGVVEKIGIKTSRIRALQGEEIVISNQELTSTRIQNFKRMKERRIVLNLGVTYQTPFEKLKKIPHLIKEIIDKTDRVRYDRAHFKSFNDSSLGIEAVYYVESQDYNDYMDLNQKIHFAIKEVFENEGISFAYPTQTIFTKN